MILGPLKLFKNKMVVISWKNKIYIFCFFCKIGLVSNHLWKKQLYMTVFEWIIGLWKWFQKQKKFYGVQFSERGSIFGWLYLGNSIQEIWEGHRRKLGDLIWSDSQELCFQGKLGWDWGGWYDNNLRNKITCFDIFDPNWIHT